MYFLYCISSSQNPTQASASICKTHLNCHTGSNPGFYCRNYRKSSQSLSLDKTWTDLAQKLNKGQKIQKLTHAKCYKKTQKPDVMTNSWKEWKSFEDLDAWRQARLIFLYRNCAIFTPCATINVQKNPMKYVFFPHKNIQEKYVCLSKDQQNITSNGLQVHYN